VRLVLDTNVLIAAFVSRGMCHDLLEHCQREHELITSEVLLREFEGNLLNKFKVPPAAAREATALLRRGSADFIRARRRAAAFTTRPDI
jgi:predicted nucleic acid-binding protein